MAPILGIYASQISGHLFAPSGAYDSIATVTASGSASVLTFSSIPSTYQHLQIRGIARDGVGSSITMTFNSDTSGNYARHRLTGDGSSAAASGSASTAFIPLLGAAGIGSATSTFAALIIDILDYANTSKYKTARALNGLDQNGSGGVELASGLWQSTVAINTITLTDGGANNFSTGTTFALYGIRGN
jgi:hypothetical protein